MQVWTRPLLLSRPHSQLSVQRQLHINSTNNFTKLMVLLPIQWNVWSSPHFENPSQTKQLESNLLSYICVVCMRFPLMQLPDVPNHTTASRVHFIWFYHKKGDLYTVYNKTILININLAFPWGALPHNQWQKGFLKSVQKPSLPAHEKFKCGCCSSDETLHTCMALQKGCRAPAFDDHVFMEFS